MQSPSDHSMAQRLAAEIMAASRGEGSAVKKREDTHRMVKLTKLSLTLNGNLFSFFVNLLA
jgi:ribosomal protein S7